MIRKQVKITQYNVKTFPSKVTFLEGSQGDIPKYLNTFLGELIMYDVHKKKTRLNKKESTSLEEDPNFVESDEDDATDGDDAANVTRHGVKKDYIAHSIISALRPKSFNSSLQLAAGLYTYKPLRNHPSLRKHPPRKKGENAVYNLITRPMYIVI